MSSSGWCLELHGLLCPVPLPWMSLLTSIPSGLSAFDKTHGIISHPILYISLYIYLYQIIISHPKISHYYILHFMHIDDELPSPWPNSPCDAHQLRARHRNPPGVGSARPCPNALGSPCHESPGETMDRGNFGWASKGFKGLQVQTFVERWFARDGWWKFQWKCHKCPQKSACCGSVVWSKDAVYPW